MRPSGDCGSKIVDSDSGVGGTLKIDRLLPAVRQNAAFQNIYWRCLMGAGRCDEGGKYLRDKLETGGRSRLIQTVRGAGYALRG